MFSHLFGDDSDRRHRSRAPRGNAARRRRARPRPDTVAAMIEHLEQRVVFSADPIGSRVNEGLVTTLAWQGQQVEAIRDSWLVRMPTPANPLSLTFAGYRARAPQVPAGWSIDTLHYGFYSLRAPGASVQQVSAWGQASGALAFEPDFVLTRTAVPDDPSFGDGSLWGLEKIAGPRAWDATTGSRSIVLGVVDSGVDITHPDLAANIWVNPDEVEGDGIDNDGNGYVDDVHGWNFGGDNADLTDTVGHGTHVAGTMGAVGNNGVGVVGVNWATSLMVLKLGDIPSAAVATQAINYTTDMRGRGIPIVATNNSYGGSVPSALFEQAIRLNNDAGVLFVASAGNDGGNNDIVSRFPTNYDVPNVVSVAASTQTDTLATFSNNGARAVDIAAPGVGILSTVIAAENTGGYGLKSGTSMAAPHVAGVAGLIAAAYFDATGTLPTVQEMRSAILEGADVIPTVAGVSGLTNAVTRGVVAGNRRLSAFGALDHLLGAEASVRVVRPSGREGHAGTTAVEFSVRLAKPVLLDPVEVTYTTVDGAAVAGEDYVAATGTLVFQPGEQFKTVTVQVNGDRDLEDDESFSLTLTSVLNGRLGPQRRAEYTIVNDEAPLVTIRPAVALEGTGRRTSAVFEVSVTGDTSVPIMVSYGTRDGTAQARRDYVPVQGMVILQPGERSKTIAVKVIGDTVPEADEVFSLVATARNGTLDEQSLVVPGYIIDDDSRVISVSAASPTVQGGGPATFRVALERIGGFAGVFPTAPAGVELPPLTISATVGAVSQSLVRGVPRAIGGTDFTPISRTVTFTPDLLSHTITVPTSPVDGPRAFLMRVVNVENARVGNEAAGTVILGAADQADATQFTARPAGRASGRLSMAGWGGFGRRR